MTQRDLHHENEDPIIPSSAQDSVPGCRDARSRAARSRDARSRDAENSDAEGGDPRRLATELCVELERLEAWRGETPAALRELDGDAGSGGWDPGSRETTTDETSTPAARDPAARDPAARDPAARDPAEKSPAEAGRDDDAEIHRYFAGVASFDTELASLARVDALLRSTYGTLGDDVRSPSSARVDGILRELRDPQDLGLARRTRRTVRTLVWITALLLSLLGAYAFVHLALRALAD